MHARTRRALAAVAFVSVIGGTLLVSGTAEARKPEDIFAGRIITAKKDIPRSARSARAYVHKLKKLRTRRFWENETKHQWKVYFAAFFRRPLNDLEVTITMYDVTRRHEKHMLSTFTQYLGRRGQRALISHVVLQRKFFGVNKEILMVISNHHHVLASSYFQIRGKAPHYSGNVNFTKAETAGH